MTARRPKLLAGIAAVVVAALPSVATAQDVDRVAAAAAMASAYPQAIESARPDAIVWRDGRVTPLGDVRAPVLVSHIIEAPSLGEQFLFAYPLWPWSAALLPRDDPGRFRHQAFFLKMYGDCRRGEVTRRLRRITWLPNSAAQGLTVTTVNGVDRALEAISAEIEKLPWPMRRVAFGPVGGFSCRMIHGTDRLSMHAFGAAIDLNPRVGTYWKWAGLTPYARANHRVPREIIDIFERHGFIWGGKWYHVDSTHFEYRPELLEYARRLTEVP